MRHSVLLLVLAATALCSHGASLGRGRSHTSISLPYKQREHRTLAPPGTSCRGAVQHAPTSALSRSKAAAAVLMRGGGAPNAGRVAAIPATPSRKVGVGWPIFSAWLYFLACAVSIPALPKIVNEIVNVGGGVTGKSATTYALIASTDALFTFMTTNMHATLSDTYGRKAFMVLSSLGLGVGFSITLASRRMWTLLLAAAIDGSTSCMYAIAQACVTDCVGRGDSLSEALGLFQGLAIGMAFTIGMPLGGIITAKRGCHTSLMISITLCALNALIMAAVMPETLARDAAHRRDKVDWTMANPVGALRLLSRSPLSMGISICFCLHWIANAGLQINFFNYTEKKLGWTAAQSGGGLALMGLLVAVAPKAIIPFLGLRRALPVCYVIFGLSQALIGVAPAHGGTLLVYTGLGLAAVGAVAFPAVLALLSQQVAENEAGAVQGAADTIKTATTVCANPLMAACFGYFISNKAPKGLMGGSYLLGGGVGLLAAVVSLVTLARYGHLAPEGAAKGASAAAAKGGVSPTPRGRQSVKPAEERWRR